MKKNKKKKKQKTTVAGNVSASYFKKKKKTPRAKWFNKQIKTRVIYAREQQHDTLFTRKHIPCCLLLDAAGRECFFFLFCL